MTERTHAPAGDLLRAFSTLEPRDDETRVEMARLLDLDWSDAIKARPRARLVRRPRKPADLPSLPEVTPESRAPETPDPLRMGPDRPAQEQAEAARVRRVKGPAAVPPAWLRGAAPFTEAALGLSPAEPAAPLPDLFVSSWTRAILSALLSTARRDGDIDVAVLIERIVKGEALSRVPRRARPTLAAGVQILVDRSAAMTPFLGDVSRIVAQIAALAGQDAVDEVLFDGCPTRGAARPCEEDWRPFTNTSAAIGDDRPLMPVPGTRIVCVTDLGIGHAGASAPASPAEWLQFAERARQARCPVVYLVPYGPDRWPPPLARRLTIVQWDRQSTAAGIARAVRRRAWRRERA